jgi:uncharacterized protein YegJ (DUF2314 family)
VAISTAVYDYEAQAEEELSLKEGETVYVIENEDSDWWLVRTGDQYGFVPCSYLKTV